MKICYLIYSIYLLNNYLYPCDSAEVKVIKQGDTRIRNKSTKLLELKRRCYSVWAEFHGECLYLLE